MSLDLKNWTMTWIFDEKGEGVLGIDTPPGTDLASEEVVLRTLVGALSQLCELNGAAPVSVGEVIQFDSKETPALPFPE